MNILIGTVQIHDLVSQDRFQTLAVMIKKNHCSVTDHLGRAHVDVRIGIDVLLLQPAQEGVNIHNARRKLEDITGLAALTEKLLNSLKAEMGNV